MPPQADEERLVTVFADIHYYFTAPTPRPLHHRFDKGSYLYIYHNASHNKARIEIANNPGTPDQDAFHGSLDAVHIRHSTQFPTLCTLTVEGVPGSPQQQASQYEWRLPSADQHNEQHQLHRLHTLDIYLWTLEDADQLLDAVERILATSQLETDRHPPTQSQQQLSSVVQQLEDIAVSDPAYQNGQTPNSRSEPAATAAPVSQGIPPNLSFPPPPPSGPPAEQHQANVESQTSAEQRDEPASTAPLPYNPAAPAAPEPIQHREKTPPPEDGTQGTGLAAAAAADQGLPYTPPHQVAGGVGMAAFAGPPTSPQGAPYTAPPSYISPPPSAGLTHTGSFPASSSAQSPVVPSYTQAVYAGGQQWTPNTPGTVSFAPPPQDPNAHLYAPQVYGSPQSPPSISGYSHYSYDQRQPLQQPGASEYDVHSQVYRPTEAELHSHAQKNAQKAMKNPGQRPRKLEDGAARFESGVNRFLKKLEKKL
ncbi:uncharacterized protein N7459_008834 [Penicillium hispanicum]|uniref:uncharacterized protein n=1 Tax=Penicillium hispanicum TaxID=1080232 RepID=UPI002540B848|nr:uncharacterized protein N7459_008834 [Penicillium hispanicum]KAJ5574407.1 hypothetical protein N7459_008834 [Penicillium hispanicum]